MVKVEIKRLAETIKKYRGINNQSQKEFAQQSEGKFSPSYVRDIENGITSRGGEISPTLYMLQSLAETMDKSLQELLSEIGVIRNYPLFYVTEVESVSLINDLNFILKRNHINVEFPIHTLTEVQVQELTELVVLLLDLVANKYKI